MDFYQFLVDQSGITRRNSKDLTLGRFYYMGAAKLAVKLGTSVSEAKSKLAEFDLNFPFVKEIADLCMNKAKQRGYIKTLMGRKKHFDSWEPDLWQDDRQRRIERGENLNPVSLASANERWPKDKLRRAHTHKALNALIQGSAADMTKQCMVHTYEETGKIPYLQLHDETDHGVRGDEGEKLKRLAEACVKLQVPVRADMHIGDHWK